MAEYKLYVLGETGLIARGVWFAAAGDDAAIEKARAIACGAPTELWQDQRLVEEFPGHVVA